MSCLSGTIRLIPASEQDMGTLVALRRQIWATTYRSIYPDHMLDDFDEAWHRERELQRIRRSDHAAWLIVLERRPIGYLILCQRKIVTMQSLYILQAHQRQGVGTLAMDFVAGYCRDRGADFFVCQCTPANVPARRFYEKHGGRIIGEDRSDPESWKHAVIYRFDVKKDP